MLREEHFCFLTPKKGNAPEECEDSISFGIWKRKRLARSGLNVAIADGATESSFSKEWSDLLTKSFCRSDLPHPDGLLQNLPGLRIQWEAMITEKTLPWYAQEKAEKGAYSAFLGLSINLEDHSYGAIAVGDCCLFQVRNEMVISNFPILLSSEFGNNPYLVSSKSLMNTDLESNIRITGKDIMKGDTLFLMSDAMSDWFMSGNEMSQHPWEILKTFKKGKSPDKDKLSAWLEEQRIKKDIKNDDVVLSIIEFY